MNLLLKEDRVIVTPVPGTTRDAVEETINIEGIAFKLIDTAGMIDSEDIVEIEGIKKSKNHIENSDIILLVIDSSRSLCRQDIDLMKNIKDKIFIVVLNKVDLLCKVEKKDIIKKIKAKYIIEVSALTSKGLKKLENTIVKSVYSGSLNKSSDIIISNQRHITVLNEALKSMKKAVGLSTDISFAELISEDIKEAIDKLSEITGEIFTEDILKNIFQRFCIGK
jgi:tRNA modification GTPase